MRSLFLLRGVPGSGKSTWVKENNLEPYALSTDAIRLMYQSLELCTDGTEIISQKNDKMVWETLFDMLEKRMENGELVIIDATHYKAPLINKYKDLVDKYRYRVYVVNFTDISEEELLRRNENRGFRKVPVETIQKMLVCLNDESEIRNAYTILKPDEAARMINEPLKPVEIDKEKVVVFGDIHGCLAPLKEYFDKNPFNENICYIFCGDYIDRGIQNKETLDFLLSIYKNKNVILLEGNHEKWLRLYSDKNYNIEKFLDKKVEYKDFFVTKVINELKYVTGKISKEMHQNEADVEKLLIILEAEKKTNPNTEEAYFEFELINVPQKIKELLDKNKNLEAKLQRLQEYTLAIKREEQNTEKCIENINKYYKEIEGEKLSLDVFGVIKNAFNLDIDKEKNPIKSQEFMFNTYDQIKNDVFNKDLLKEEEKPKLTDLELLKQMYKSPLINVKYLKDDVISLNFTRDAFYDQKWNDLTCTARGLFVNKKTGDVVARSFTKFFNYNEVDVTKSDNLQKIFKYPVVGYKKENGFLGLITKYNGGIKFYTKSSDDGDYVKWFKDIFYKLTGLNEEELLNKLKDNYTYIFECVDPNNDPHIIKYDECEVFLLEVMKNQMEEEHISYDDLCVEGKKLNVKVKEKAFVFNSWEEFNNWKEKFRRGKTQWDCKDEGFVFEDAAGFRVKFKSSFYKFWKQMRTVKEKIQKGAGNEKICINKEEIEVVKLLEGIEKDKLKNMSIIDVEEKYYDSKK